MTFRWLPGLVVLFVAFVISPSVGSAQQQTCTEVPKGGHDTVSAMMQGLGGASAVVLLVGGERVRWVMKAAAAAGLTSAVWGAAKSYFDSGAEKVVICTKPTLSTLAGVQEIYVGPPVITQKLSDNNELLHYLDSQEGARLLNQTKPMTWFDPCLTGLLGSYLRDSCGLPGTSSPGGSLSNR